MELLSWAQWKIDRCGCRVDGRRHGRGKGERDERGEEATRRKRRKRQEEEATRKDPTERFVVFYDWGVLGLGEQGLGLWLWRWL